VCPACPSARAPRTRVNAACRGALLFAFTGSRFVRHAMPPSRLPRFVRSRFSDSRRVFAPLPLRSIRVTLLPAPAKACRRLIDALAISPVKRGTHSLKTGQVGPTHDGKHVVGPPVLSDAAEPVGLSQWSGRLVFCAPLVSGAGPARCRCAASIRPANLHASNENGDLLGSQRSNAFARLTGRHAPLDM
jgi:hypothetical protein